MRATIRQIGKWILDYHFFSVVAFFVLFVCVCVFVVVVVVVVAVVM